MAIRPKRHAELGMRIARAVGLSEKNQVSFASLLGVHPSNLNRWISGEVAPSYEYISRIGLYSGVSLDWLLTGEEPMVKKKSKETKITSDKEDDFELREIVDILEHDLPEMKKYVLKILKGRKEIKEGMIGLKSFDKNLIDENA